MSDTEDTKFFADEASEALKELHQFIVRSASVEHPSVNEFKEILDRAMQSLPETDSSFFGILDIAYEEASSGNLFPEDLDQIMESLMDDLNEAQPLLRVTHNPSDQWSVVEKLCGDGHLEAIAYFASPTMAENCLGYMESQVTSV